MVFCTLFVRINRCKRLSTTPERGEDNTTWRTLIIIFIFKNFVIMNKKEQLTNVTPAQEIVAAGGEVPGT